MKVLQLIYMAIGFIYAVVTKSFIHSLDNYFFHETPLTGDMWQQWGLYVIIPAMVGSLICGIIDAIKYADNESSRKEVYKGVLLSPVDPTWIIPCMAWGLFWSWIMLLLDLLVAVPWGLPFLQAALEAWGLPTPEPVGSFKL